MNLRQTLITKTKNIKPLTKAPITIEYFNGEKYTADDGIQYMGYTPVVVGTISTNEEDINYLSQDEFDKLAMDAYDDVNTYLNGGLSVMGVFNETPNFSSIPVFTKDNLMKAIAAKLEQSLFTNPANAELRVTLTSSSGGRTQNIPARENFNPDDILNEKVKDYILKSGIVDLIKDSFEAIKLDRNDYYTKDEIDALLESGMDLVPVEDLFTRDVDNYVPTEDGDGVNKKYVDAGDAELQSQINSLVVGDFQIDTSHIKVKDQTTETLSGAAVEQSDANTEFTAAIKKNITGINDIGLRQGVPFQGYKTLAQEVTTLAQLQDYDDVNAGTYDGLNGFDATTGIYTIPSNLEGNLIAIETTVKVVGDVKPGIKAGTVYLYKNGAPFVHPVTNLPMKQEFIIDSINGVEVSIRATDFAIRVAGTGNGEVEIGDAFSVWVEQEGTSSNPLSVSDVNFDLVNLKQLNSNIFSIESESVITQADESISGTSLTQRAVNIENKDALDNVQSQIDNIESESVTTQADESISGTSLTQRAVNIENKNALDNVQSQIDNIEGDINQDTMIVVDNNEVTLDGTDYYIFKDDIVKQFDDTSKVQVVNEADGTTIVDRYEEGQGNLYFEFYVDYVDTESGTLQVETYNYDTGATTHTIEIPYTFTPNYDEDGNIISYQGGLINGQIKSTFLVGKTAFRYKPTTGSVKISKAEIDEYVGRDAIAFADGVKVEDVKWGDKVDKEVVGTDGSKGEIFNRKFSTGDSVVWMAVQRPVGDVDTVGTNRVEMRIQDNYGASDAVQALIRAGDANNKAMPYVPVTGASIVTKDYVDKARVETHKALMQEIEILRAEIRNLKR